jgi:hypothetical protein
MNERMNVRKILPAVRVVCCGLPWEEGIGRTRCKECPRKSGRACHLERSGGILEGSFERRNLDILSIQNVLNSGGGMKEYKSKIISSLSLVHGNHV